MNQPVATVDYPLKKRLIATRLHSFVRTRALSTEVKAKIDEIKDLDARIDALKGMRKVLLNEWALENCPHSVGDIAIVRGYSHVGKQCKITSVGWKQDFRGRYRWTVRGLVILKDGTVGKMVVDWDESQEKA